MDERILIPYARTKNKHPERGTVDTVVLVDGLGRVLQTKKTAEVEGHGIGWSVSGHQVFDALGRVAQQGQTTFESGSQPYYVGKPPLNPTYFSYDVLGRTTLTQEPNGAAPGGLASTWVAYGFGRGCAYGGRRSVAQPEACDATELRDQLSGGNSASPARIQADGRRSRGGHDP